jgi:hypothetical protein
VIDKATLSETLLDSSLFVARLFIYAFIMGVIVLAVDVVVLLLLNLWNVHTWLNLLLVEGSIMASVGGTAGLYNRFPAPIPTVKGPGTHLYKKRRAVKRLWFWVSFGIAGLMLILVGFLIWQSR